MQEAVKPRPQYEILRNPHQREIILRRGLELVAQASQCEQVVFLDKSARPLVLFLINFWPQLYPDKPLPDCCFLNIGSGQITQVRILQGRDPHQLVDPSSLDKKDLVRIFSDFDQVIEVLKPDQVHRRLIVDFCQVTGSSVRLASHLIKVIDPLASTGAFVFLKDLVDRNHFPGLYNLPYSPWSNDLRRYFPDDSQSRLVLSPQNWEASLTYHDFQHLLKEPQLE